MKKARKCAAVLVLLCVFTAGAVKAEIENGDFEETQVLSEKDGRYRNMEKLGWKFDKPLLFPAGWVTNPGVRIANGEYRLISESGKAQSGKNCIFVRGHFRTTQSIKVSPGDTIEISFYAMDPDEKDVYAYLYLYGFNEEGKKRFIGSPTAKQKAKSEWARLTAVLVIPEKAMDTKVAEVLVALSSKTGAYFDNVEITRKKSE